MLVQKSKEREEKFHLCLRIIHWAMAIGIIILLIGGFYSTQLHNMPFSEYIPTFHRTVGTALLVLVFLRIAIRLSTQNPKVSDHFPFHVRMAAIAAQIGLYVFMIMIPLSGFLIANMSDHGVVMYGLQLPEFFVGNEFLAMVGKQTHYLFAYAGALLIVAHVGAVIYHRMIDKVNLLPGMTIDVAFFVRQIIAVGKIVCEACAYKLCSVQRQFRFVKSDTVIFLLLSGSAILV